MSDEPIVQDLPADEGELYDFLAAAIQSYQDEHIGDGGTVSLVERLDGFAAGLRVHFAHGAVFEVSAVMTRPHDLGIADRGHRLAFHHERDGVREKRVREVERNTRQLRLANGVS